ncbi:MAG TPA: hypothetical protein P5036_15400 [Albidovulum sp.]|nr:hypothetical protein [Albidovulum sp.]
MSSRLIDPDRVFLAGFSPCNARSSKAGGCRQRRWIAAPKEVGRIDAQSAAVADSDASRLDGGHPNPQSGGKPRATLQAGAILAKGLSA